MLSLFPDFFTYSLIAPFLLRLTLAAVFLYWAYGKIKSRENAKVATLGLLEAVVGILLVVGLFTQMAALVAALILVVKLIGKIHTKSLFTSGVNYYFILFIISFSLLFLGPGAFAFDLPL